MNRTTADRLVAFLVTSLIIFGTYNWWLVYRRTQTTNSIIEVPLGDPFGIDPVWYALGTVVGVPLLMGGYFIVRRANQSV